MCKGKRRFKCLVQIPIWDSGYTKVTEYKRVMIYIYGKTAKKAVEELETTHAILRVWAG